jgi:SpoVK/Ycf46/Vps4 family AAA+-type ATPase
MDLTPEQIKILEQQQSNSPPPSYTMASQLDHSLMSNPPAHVFEEDDDYEQEVAPNVSITIRAGVTVKGNHNIISVDPSTTGCKIAVAIVTGLRQMSGVSGGVPMIDENGRPRPITVDVDASTKIEGSDNFLGEKAVATATSAKQGAAQNVTKKRDRSSSDPEGSSKRPKTE